MSNKDPLARRNGRQIKCCVTEKEKLMIDNARGETPYSELLLWAARNIATLDAVIQEMNVFIPTDEMEDEIRARLLPEGVTQWNKEGGPMLNYSDGRLVKSSEGETK